MLLIEKLETLVDRLIVLTDTVTAVYAKKAESAPAALPAPAPSSPAAGTPEEKGQEAPPPPPAEKKTRKPRTSSKPSKEVPAGAPAGTVPASPAAAAAALNSEEMPAWQKETFDLTLKFVELTKNETPQTGQQWAKTVLLPSYGVKQLAELTEQQAVAWRMAINAEIAKRSSK